MCRASDGTDELRRHAPVLDTPDVEVLSRDRTALLRVALLGLLLACLRWRGGEDEGDYILVRSVGRDTEAVPTTQVVTFSHKRTSTQTPCE